MITLATYLECFLNLATFSYYDKSNYLQIGYMSYQDCLNMEKVVSMYIIDCIYCDLY